MRKEWLAVLGIFVTGLAAAAGPAPAATSAHQAEPSLHDMGMNACRNGRNLNHEAWRIHAYAVPDAVSSTMLAATEGDTGKVRAGLAALPADTVARWRQTALLTAVLSNRPDTASALMADGADPDARSWIPPYTERFYQAVAARLPGDPRFGGRKVVKNLQDSGLMQNKGQWVPFMLNQAAACDLAPVIDALVRGGASVNAHPPVGFGPLVTAVQGQNPHALRALLDHGANTCYFDRRSARFAKREHRKPVTLADIARKNGLPADLVARLQCHAP